MKKNLLTIAAFLATKGYNDGVNSDSFKALKPEDQAKLFDELNTHNQEVVNSIREDVDATKEDLTKAMDELRKGHLEQMKVLNDAISEVGVAVKQMNEMSKPMTNDEKKSLRQLIADHSETFKSIIAKKTNPEEMKALLSKVNLEVVAKGTQGASDIGDRDYLGEIEAGIGRKPVRRTRILDLFRSKTVTKEFLHYWEENVVTRDAKFVIACATSEHNTKKTWAMRTVQLAKIRDIVDVCIDMLEDYDFVESELRQLVNESIMLKIESELLLGGAALPTDMLSIDSIASEFNASNVLADYSAKFTSPTIGDLTAAMKGQIYTFGQENAWNADTVIMNYTDMITYLHAKNADGNYLFPNFVSGATDVVNGMRIVTSPIVAQNTLYVFDSTRGSILNRKRVSINAYFENKDNAEHELVTFKGVARLQFHVRNIDQDAFMKCSDIEAALGDIEKVVS